MKIHEVKIVFDKDVFFVGGKVTGKLIVKTKEENWGEEGKAFVKIYDKLDIEWIEDEMVTVGITKRAYTNFQKPFQLNIEKILDKSNVITGMPDNHGYYSFAYPFEFELPNILLGTLNVLNAKNQYFMKAYLTHDESIAKHYQEGVNVFGEFFKSLNHTYTKQEVFIPTKISDLSEFNGTRIFEAKSTHLKMTVSLQKIAFHRGDKIDLLIKVERVEEDNKRLDLHKIGFKLFQVVKLKAQIPHSKERLFENLIAHSSLKNVHQNSENGIEIKESIQIPKDIPSSSSRIDIGKTKLNPIRVNYKLSLQLWKNVLVDDLDINIPILVDPSI